MKKLALLIAFSTIGFSFAQESAQDVYRCKTGHISSTEIIFTTNAENDFKVELIENSVVQELATSIQNDSAIKVYDFYIPEIGNASITYNSDLPEGYESMAATLTFEGLRGHINCRHGKN